MHSQLLSVDEDAIDQAINRRVRQGVGIAKLEAYRNVTRQIVKTKKLCEDEKAL